MTALAKLPDAIRALAEVIRKHGTCPPAALDHVADELEAALSPAEMGGVEWHWICSGDWGEIVESMPTGDDTYATGYQDALNSVTRKLCSLPRPSLTPPSAKGE